MLESAFTYIKASLKVNIADPVLITIVAKPSLPAGIEISSWPALLVMATATIPDIVTLVTPLRLFPLMMSLPPPRVLKALADIPLICGAVLVDKPTTGAAGVIAALVELVDEVPVALVAVAVNVYEVPFVNGEMTHEVAGDVTVQVAPPGDAVTR